MISRRAILLNLVAMANQKLSPDVKKVFDAYPKVHRKAMLAIRELIYEVAGSIEDVGELEETLKWGEPAYLTAESKTGTTIRIDWKRKNPDVYGIYFNCQTSLLERFRNDYPDEFQFDRNRAIMLPVDEPLPIGPLSKCFAVALTYHRDKHRSKRQTKNAG